MARIVQYEQQTTPSAGRQPPLANAPPALNEGAMGGGFDALGRGLAHLGANLQEKDNEEARAWSASALSQARLDWTTQLLKRQAKAKPGAPDFTPTVVKDFDTYSDEVVARAPTQAAKVYLKQRLDDLRATVGGQAMHFEANARIDWRTDQFTTAIDNTQKLMNTDPSQYKVALAERLAEIDGSNLPPIQKSALREKAVNGVSAAAVWSQIQKSPTGFLQSIGFDPSVDPATGKLRKTSSDLTGATGNAAFDALPFDKRAMLFESAVRLKAQIDQDANIAIKAKQKQLSDDAMKGIWDQWASGKLNRNYIEGVRQLLSPEEYHSSLIALKQMQTGTGQKTDPGAFRELLRLEGTDPQEAESYAFRMNKAGLLSNEHLASAVGRIRTVSRQEGPKSEYELGRSFIVQSLDPGPMVPDPVGKSRFANAIDTFDQWMKSGKRTDKEIRERAHGIVDQYKFINFNETVIALPSPRSGNIRRNPGDLPGMTQDMAAATKKAKADFDSGKINRGEYDSEMTILNRWRKAMDGASNGPK